MRLTTGTGCLLLALVLAWTAAGQPPAHAPKPLPPRVRAAWEEAGAQVGWMTRYEQDWQLFPLAVLAFRTEAEGGEGKSGEMPTFRWGLRRGEKMWQPGLIAKLPAPEQAFGLDLSHTPVTDADLKELARLEHLHALSLFGTQVTGAGIRHLAGLRQLRWLNLGNTAVTDATVKELAGLKGLESLNLFQTQLTGAGLKELAPLKRLHTLALGGSRLTDAGLKELTVLKQLQSLDVLDTAITDTGLRELAGLKKLKSLNLGRIAGTDAGLKEVARLPQLEFLHIGGTKVTDAGLKELRPLSQLRSLHLYYCKITDKGLKELRAFRKLEFLGLGNTKVTDIGLKELAGLKQLKWLHLMDTNVTDAGLKELGELKHLERLYLNGTGVTDAGVRELRKRMPSVQVGFIETPRPRAPAETEASSLPAGAIARLKMAPPSSPVLGLIRVFFLPDGRTLAVTTPDRKLVFWDWKTGEIKRSLEGHYQVAFVPDGKLMASRSRQRETLIRILEVDSGKQVGQAEGIYLFPGRDFAFSPDGRFLAVGGGSNNRRPQDPPLWLWEVATGKKVAQFPLREMLGSLAFSPNGKYLATSMYMRDIKGIQIQVWDVATRELVRSFKNEPAHVHMTAVSFSPDGKYLVSVGEGMAVRCWDAATWQEVWRLRNLGSGESLRTFTGAYSLAFSGNGQTLAVGTGSKGTIYLLEAATGRERCQFQGHTQAVFSVAFSPDGLLLASGPEAALVWDVTGQLTSRHHLGPLGSKEMETLWHDLAGEDAKKAWKAIRDLVAHPKQATALLKARLRPIPRLDQKHVAQLIADLNSDKFALRENSCTELEKLGQAALPVLRSLLTSTDSAEVKRRVERLLKRIPTQEVRYGRAVEILEYIGSPEARELLLALANGEPGCKLTQDAKSALNRLEKRPQ
jgi:internalin A